MLRKYDIDFAKKAFADLGYELIDVNYINSSTPMSYKCTCGKISQVALSDLLRKKGVQCRQCGNKSATTKRQLLAADPEYLKEYFTEQGCQLLSEYVDYYTPLKYICKCGNVGETAWYSFKKGRRCGRCGTVHFKKYTIEEVRDIFTKKGCILLSDEYFNIETPIRYKCSCGNESSITLNNFKRGQSCKICGLKKNQGSGNPRWREDREQKKLDDRFRDRCIGILHECLKRIKFKKTEHTKDILGYTYQELKTHITSHSNWEKVKSGRWHIDHIFPISAFMEHHIYDLKLINALDNLQPLTQEENNKKSGKYSKKKFKEWLSAKGIAC
jgi:DNA-directed RNA polymerase subunit RPC12/RpoP